MEIRTLSTTETEKLASQLAANLNPGDVLALYGELGSGKTTFTKYLVKHLGIPATVQSPTFVIARQYKGGTGSIKKVSHLDLYRINSTDEARELDLEEFLNDKDAVTLIEWPEIIEDDLPPHTIKILFSYANNNEERIINVQDIH